MFGRRTAVVVNVGAIALVAGLIVGSGAAAEPATTSTALAYTCTFSSGTQQASLRVAATFPPSGTVGRAVGPTQASVTVTVPTGARTILSGLKATSFTGQAQLGMTTTQQGKTVSAPWAGLAVPATPVPASGALVFTASGAVTPPTALGTGTVVFTAGSLGLVLTPHLAGGGATTPAALPVACTLVAKQNAVLASVPVTAPATTTTAPTTTSAHPTTSSPATSTTPTTSGAPPSGTDTATTPSPATSLPQAEAGADPAATRSATAPRDDSSPVPDWCTSYQGPPEDTQECAYVVGYNNVAKLKGAALLGSPDPAMASLASDDAQIYFDPSGNLHITDHTTGTLTVPPAKTTFLAFGFTPVTATLILTQVGLLSADSDITDVDPYPEVTVLTAQESVRLTDVSVNGVPLNVGPNCVSTQPVDLTLNGIAPSSVSIGPGDYTIQSGGPLNGTATLPTFTGCGVGENLDPLFNGAISGPGNYVEMTQGSLCFPGVDDPTSSGCPPLVPVPQH